MEYAQKELQKFTNNRDLQQLVGCLKNKIMNWNKSNLQDKEFRLGFGEWTRIMPIIKEAFAIIKRKPNGFREI